MGLLCCCAYCRSAFDQELSNAAGDLGTGSEAPLQDVLELWATDAYTGRDIRVTTAAPANLMTEGTSDFWRCDSARPPQNGRCRNGQRMSAKKIPLTLFREDHADEPKDAT